MGNRKFYDQLIADTCQHEKDRVTDETDVTTMKDYMQVWGIMQKVFPQLYVGSSLNFFAN